MSPLAFVSGVIFASAAAIVLGLSVTLFLVLFLGDEYPRLAAELRPLLTSLALFAVLTAISAASFVGLIRVKPWRWLAQGLMWLSLLALAGYFWPT